MKVGKGGGLRGLLRDRRVLIGAAVAGGLGLVVALRRGAGSSTSIQPAGEVDTSGTDAYNAVQDLGATWVNDLRDIKDLLQQRPGAGVGADPEANRPTTKPAYRTLPDGVRPVIPDGGTGTRWPAVRPRPTNPLAR